MAPIPRPLSFTIYQVTSSPTSVPFSPPFFSCSVEMTNAPLVCQKEGGERERKKSQTGLINVVPLTSVATKTISLHHQLELQEGLEGAPI